MDLQNNSLELFRWMKENLQNDDLEFLMQKVRIVGYLRKKNAEGEYVKSKEIYRDELKHRFLVHLEYSKYKAGKNITVCKHKKCGRWKQYFNTIFDKGQKTHKACILFRYYTENNGFKNHQLRVRLPDGRKISICLQ